MLDIKNTVPDISDISDRLISWLHMTEERISELENMSIETFKV